MEAEPPVRVTSVDPRCWLVEQDSLGDHVIQCLIADSVVTSLEYVMLCCVLLATFYTIESQKVCIALLCSLTKTVLTCCTRTPSHIP